ncbi:MULTISPECIES: hypothetical protein [unclassified Methylobacterium]|uniref:hypothetical protein n=1 Tax=unclassified Methylobacterium TaxID=2615210 RepID=UPI0011C1DC95|nr:MULTISPECIES: hypothetical protein [unclassified Methylobacterium]QEE39909.1 hypothetical protein FVA80_14045 [Methylobacterium sp. WL1]TXN51611.1 hypothetical protein FV241_30050 [Methylobacterium sp. WL2]
MAHRSFVDGLVALDAVATRKRLSEVLIETRSRTSGPGGDAVAEEIRHVESVLLQAAHWAVRTLDAALVEARAAASRPETQEEAHAAVVAALDRDDPIRPEIRRADLAAIAGRRADAPPPGC